MLYNTVLRPALCVWPLLFLFLVSCVVFPDIPLTPNQIVFLCSDCRGIQVTARYIADKKLDRRYKIIMDTMCARKMNFLSGKIRVTYLTRQEIQEGFGEFSTFLFIDSTGKRIEVANGADLRQYIR